MLGDTATLWDGTGVDPWRGGRRATGPTRGHSFAASVCVTRLRVSRRTLAIVALGVLLLAGMAPSVDLDVWHGMSLFREALREGWIPDRDRFAYTPTISPIVHHEWGAGAIAYLVGSRWGVAGLQVLRLALVLAIVVVAVRVALQRGARVPVLQALAVLAIPMAWITLTLVRAQLYTVLALAILLACLESDRRGGRRWILPWLVLWVVWVNLHAGFVVGGIFLGVHALEQWWRRRPITHLVATLGTMALLVAANPYGFSYYPYLAHALTMDRRLVVEWHPLWSAAPPAVAVTLLSMLVAALALYRTGMREAPGWPLLVVSAVAALRSQRHVSIYALVWLAYVPALVSRTNLGDVLERVQRRWGAVLWSVILIFGLAYGLRMRPWNASVEGLAGAGERLAYPVGPVEYLQGVGFEGNLLVPFTMGAYVSWKTDGHVKVSIDSRFEAAYPPNLLAEHLDFFNAGSGWRSMLERYPHDLILVERDMPVALLMREQPGWRLVYEDDTFLLFARPGLKLPYADRRGERIVGTFP